MKVAFGVRAQYAAILALSVLMVTQVIGVAIFSGKVEAATELTVTTRPATNIGPSAAKLNLKSSDLNNVESADYSFEYGTDTSYGSTVEVSSTEAKVASITALTGSPHVYYYGGDYQARDQHGNFYVSYDDKTYKYNSSGQFVLEIPIACGSNYCTMVFDSNDAMYIAGESGQVYKYLADGTSAGAVVDSPSGFSKIAIDSDDNLYVLSTILPTSKVFKFNPAGSLIDEFTLPEVTALYCGGNIAVDATDHIYIIQAEYEGCGTPAQNSKILKYASNWSLVTQWDVVAGSGYLGSQGFYIDANDVLYLSGRTLYSSSGGLITTNGPLKNTSDRLLGVDVNSGLVYSMNNGSPSLLTYARQGSAEVSDLQCGSTYHFRAKAVVDGDTVYGEDQQFSTLCGALQITTGTLDDAALGQSYSQQIATNGPGSPVVFEIIAGSLPPGIEMDASGYFSGTPLHAGSYGFTVRATDESAFDTGVDEQELSINVIGEDLDMIDSNPTLTVGEPYMQQLDSTGGLGGAVTFEVDAGSPDDLPPGLSMSSSGAISGTPTTAGSYTVGMLLTEGPLTALGYVQFNVEEPVVPPIQLTGGSLSAGRVGFSYSSNTLSASTVDGFGYRSYEVIGGTVPPGLTVDIDGTVHGTPTTAGSYSFTAEVTDITGSDNAEFTLLINPPFPPRTNTPIVSITSPATNTVFDYQHDSVTIDGSGPANQVITAYMDDDELGTTTTNSDGTWSYTAHNVFPGNHSFAAKWVPAKDAAFIPFVRSAEYSSELQIIDTASHQRIKTVLLPQNSVATSATINHEGTKVYVTGYDIATTTSTIWEFDVATGALGRTLSLTGYVGQTSQLVVTDNDQSAYLQKMTLNSLVLIKLNLASMSVTGTPTTIAMTGADWDNARNNLYSLPLTIDDESVYVAASRTNSGTADITIINQNSQAVSTITASSDSRASSNQRLIVTAGNSVYTLVNNKLITINTSSHAVTDTMTISQLDSSSNRPTALVVDAVRGKAYISVPVGRIYIVDLDTEDVSYVTLAGSSPYNTPSWGLQLTSDSSQLYGTGNFGSVQILDTQLGQLIPATNLLATTTAGQVIGAGDFVGHIASPTATVAFSVGMAPEVLEDPVVPALPIAEDPGSDQPTITDVTPVVTITKKPVKSNSIKSPQQVVAVENNLFALAKRIPEPFAITFPWLLLALALVLVGIQYSQVHSESSSTKRMQASVAKQERLVEEQNNFVALSTHYLHTPLTVMEGEISLMVKAGTLSQAQATKLKAALTSLNAEAEAALAQEEQDKVE